MAIDPVYASRRSQLFAQLPDNSVAVFPSAPVRARNSDVDHEYRQNSDLFYLTGFAEPDSVVLLGRSGGESFFQMVVRPRDKEREIWDGKRAGVDGAKATYGADEAFPATELGQVLDRATAGKETLIYALGSHGDMDGRVLDLLERYRRTKRKGPGGPCRVEDPAGWIHEMRLVKDDAGLERMKRASDITAEAHNAAMRASRPGMTERQIQAVVEGTFRMLGSARNGYPCIVAGGANATILHYNENDQPLGDGDLLLIDAGAEYDYYTADVTRTFPVNGTFSPAQKEVYEIVLEAQLASIDACRPGTSFDGVHDISVRVLTEGLVRIGLLSGEVDALITSEAYKKYYMHRTGHWIGMDVHDVGEYFGDGGTSRTLAAGMALTVEPGLYIAPDDTSVDARYRGIGIRIEDDVVVTDGEPLVLTAATPKSVADVEALMAEPAPSFPSVGA
jgi:Xaa-Pro aminopeptidase